MTLMSEGKGSIPKSHLPPRTWALTVILGAFTWVSRLSPNVSTDPTGREVGASCCKGTQAGL